MAIRIKNWNRFQSYKDRKPPWIRFHRTILDNYEFQTMSADARAILPMLWLLACEYKDPKAGIVDLSVEKIAFRLRQVPELIHKVFDELEVCGFIERNETVTEPYRFTPKSVTPETDSNITDAIEETEYVIADTTAETETETETETEEKEKEKEKEKEEVVFELPSWIPQKLWDAFLDVRKTKNKNTATKTHALNLIVNKLERWKADGYDPVEILETSVMSCWAGVFKPINAPTSGKSKTTMEADKILGWRPKHDS